LLPPPNPVSSTACVCVCVFTCCLPLCATAVLACCAASLPHWRCLLSGPSSSSIALRSQSRSGLLSAWVLRPSGAERVRSLPSGCESFCAFASCAVGAPNMTKVEAKPGSTPSSAAAERDAPRNADRSVPVLPATRPAESSFLSGSPSSPCSPPRGRKCTTAAPTHEPIHTPAALLLFERQTPADPSTTARTNVSLLRGQLTAHDAGRSRAPGSCAALDGTSSSTSSGGDCPPALLAAQGPLIALPGEDSSTVLLWEQRASRKLALAPVDSSWPTPGMCMSVQVKVVQEDE
jgi:hypothetical protein